MLTAIFLAALAALPLQLPKMSNLPISYRVPSMYACSNLRPVSAGGRVLSIVDCPPEEHISCVDQQRVLLTREDGYQQCVRFSNAD